MSSHRTMDGRPLSVGISGFTHYQTERVDAPTQPAPVLTPTDLLVRLEDLKALLAAPEVARALSVLLDHVNDENNPHHTTLSQFTDQVIDALYAEYVRQGGIAKKAIFAQAIFQPLRIATVDEMENSTAANLLVSIFGAKKSIQNHELDPAAHSELLTHMFPGRAITTSPCWALEASTGLSWLFMEREEQLDDDTNRPYSYVAEDGFLHYCSSLQEIPVDYIHGEPTIPCFGPRTNDVRESTNFITCRLDSVSILANSEVAPDNTATATAVFTGNDTMNTLHTVAYEDVYLPANQTRTFSVFAKAEKCRYLAINWLDMKLSQIKVRAIFDLKDGKCICMNHMDRYSARIQSLGNGWFRCELSMYHEIGQEHDIEMTFFHGDINSDLTFIGTGELCGYLWGMQLENGPTASPYIPTVGDPATRKGGKIAVSVEDSWFNKEAMTIGLSYLNPKSWLDKESIRTLFAFYDGYHQSIATEVDSTGAVRIEQYETLEVDDSSAEAVVSQIVIPGETTKEYHQLVFSYDSQELLAKLNAREAIPFETPEKRNAIKKLYLGAARDGAFLEGYLRSVVIYPIKVTPDQATFLNGEEIHG